MKALSIRQPWAWLIVHGHKPIENRDWTTSFRGELLIHAGKTFEHEALASILDEFPHLGAVMPTTYDMGGIVGVAQLANVVTQSNSPWFTGPFGLVMREAKPLPLHVLRGQLGLFEVPDDIARRCLASAASASTAEAEAAGQARLLG